MSTPSLSGPRTPGLEAEHQEVESGIRIGVTGGSCGGARDKDSEEEDQADLEAQLRVQAIVDLLEKIPKKLLWELLVALEVQVPPPDAGSGISKFALVCAGNQHLHEELHRNSDLVSYEVTVCCYVEDLVDNGFMPNPWVVSGEEQPSVVDVYQELSIYVQGFNKQDLQLAVFKICCICLLDAKTQPMSESELREELIGHLQHRANEQRDLSTEANVLRCIYRDREDASDQEGVTSRIEAPNDVHRVGAVAVPTTPPGLPNILSEDESLVRIEDFVLRLRDLPEHIVIDVLADKNVQLLHTLGEKAFPLTKEHIIDVVAELLRGAAASGSAIAFALMRCDNAVDRHVEKWLSNALQRKLISRGRPWHSSKKFKAVATAQALRAAVSQGGGHADADSD